MLDLEGWVEVRSVGQRFEPFGKHTIQDRLDGCLPKGALVHGRMPRHD